jgi:ankyrin repeat protein
MDEREGMREGALRCYKRAMAVLESGSPAQLEELAGEIAGFPEGEDPYIGRHWITNALDSGSRQAVEWMLQRHVDLNFCDPEGYTPLHTALELEREDKYELLDALLSAGAPVNLKGLNDWTPAHMAAAQDDVEALRVLVRHGADLTIRTDIDDHATPLEEARNLGKGRAISYLESVV